MRKKDCCVILVVMVLPCLLCSDEYKVLHKEEWSDINIITGCLKLYFRELPEPLIPAGQYSAFIDAISMSHGGSACT